MVRDEQGELLGYLSTSRDVSEARRAREVAQIASAEMRHRLKNSYAMVAGLFSSLARGLPAREEFAAEISTRLAALGVAQTMFVARDNAPCELSELLHSLLDPFGHPDCPIAIAVPGKIMVDQRIADALALVLGELGVNSSKHGALGHAGHIEVEIDQADGRTALRWIEQSERPVEAHERSGGQGLRLMQRILEAQGGEITIDWLDCGLIATILLPTAELSAA